MLSDIVSDICISGFVGYFRLLWLMNRPAMRGTACVFCLIIVLLFGV